MIETMLLAAGYSTRLYPLTQRIPKPLLPFLDRRLIHFTLEYLKSFGVRSLCTNVHHGQEEYLKVLADLGTLKPYVEPKILGTGGGIKNMRGFVKGDDFMVINCDFLTDVDLHRAYEAHKKRNALATLVLIEHPEQRKYGEVGVDDQGTILFFRKAERNHPAKRRGLFTGIHFMRTEIFDHMPHEDVFCIVKDVYEPLLKKGVPIHAHVQSGRWLDTGEKKYFAQSQFELLDAPLPWMPALSTNGSALIGENVEMGNGVNLLDHNVIGAHARIGAHATLRNCVVFPGSSIEAGSHHESAIIFDRSSLVYLEG